MGNEMKGNSVLPTKEEIAILPLLAQIALAVRCAKRIQLLLENYLSEGECLEAINRIIKFAEKRPSWPAPRN